ncbi:hypothetical protein Tco_0814950, partial [Tanacetum coccineum]
ISQEVGTPRYLSLVAPLTKIGDEAVHKESGDKMERAATIASSLEAEQDSDTILGDVHAQTRFEITSIQSIDPPLSRGYTLRSGEDSMKLIGIDEICGTLYKIVRFEGKPSKEGSETGGRGSQDENRAWRESVPNTSNDHKIVVRMLKLRGLCFEEEDPKVRNEEMSKTYRSTRVLGVPEMAIKQWEEFFLDVVEMPVEAKVDG